MINFKQHGDFSKLTYFLEKEKKAIDFKKLNSFGEKGVAALSSATPVDTGKTAGSWSYKIIKSNNSVSINFLNSNINDGVPIAIILQYGHGTRNGGWVEGKDYINPAIQPIFNEIEEYAWREVTKS